MVDKQSIQSISVNTWPSHGDPGIGNPTCLVAETQRCGYLGCRICYECGQHSLWFGWKYDGKWNQTR